ncbi:histone H2A deubiquitinase MYSM1-like [Homarus americanus]|uniref:histone H2A deubiquitinase MYSM1-like n=1 Tax=Homarus americanus TaxID=6706 RepID=UPI001C4800D9|nr:histone H2A deubiquitinase MYSM1-like [Homarus americanus]
MASSDDIGGTLDVDVVGLVDLDFKSEPDFFDFDSGGEFGLFGEAGVALHTTATTTTQSNQSCSTTVNGNTTVGSSCSSSHHTTGSPNSKKTSNSRKRKSHWNAVEKDLFQKGLELFGPNWNRLSNFIATKTSGQVRSFHKKWAETANIVQEAETVGETCVYMPADQVCITTTDLDDPLGLIETATTTVTTTPLSPKRNKKVDSSSQASSAVEDNSKGFNSSGEIFVPNIAEEWIIESDGFVCSNPETLNNFRKKNENKKKVNHIKKKKNSMLSSNVPFKIKSPQKQTPKKKKKLRITLGPTSSERENVIHSQTLPKKDGKSDEPKIAMPVLGQVVHIVKNEMEESDVDIDISDDEELMIEDKPPSNVTVCNNIEDTVIIEPDESIGNKEDTVSEDSGIDDKKQQVFNFPPPAEERTLNLEDVTDEEKKVHSEYFDGKGVKTPERYLKIRNYLITFWNQVKPKYMRKTIVRAGLRNCGDVNSIGKVHEYLEKIGAINFGCPESNYTSPLVIGVKQKEKVTVPTKPSTKVDRSEMTRQKQKKKWDASMSEGGGLTISHDESGAVVDACHIPEAPRSRAGPGSGPNGGRLEQFKLVRCLEHDPDTPAPFSVVMHAHALITLDLHTHTSHAEVMGLLGGYYDPATQTLYVTVAVPTQAVSTGVECDMCPISQSTACTVIHEGGVQVVGWYHSHPTFPPNPSVQDIDTQDQMQQWFARQDAPFLGIIVSPFCPTNRNEASQIRCIVLDKPPHKVSGKEEVESFRSPYKLFWSVSEVIPGAWEEVCQGVRAVVAGARDDSMAVEWRGEWRGQLTYWEKAIASLNHHLPLHLHEPLQSVRTTFLAAVREYLDA